MALTKGCCIWPGHELRQYYPVDRHHGAVSTVLYPGRQPFDGSRGNRVYGPRHG